MVLFIIREKARSIYFNVDQRKPKFLCFRFLSRDNPFFLAHTKFTLLHFFNLEETTKSISPYYSHHNRLCMVISE